MKDFSLKYFSSYHHIHLQNQIACGGTSIFVKNNVVHQQVPLVTDLQAVAVRVTLHRPVTICSMYLPPQTPFSLKSLENIVEQLPKPFVLLGDFNAHSDLWGNTHTDARGKIVEDFIHKNNICLYNTDCPTYLNPSNLNPSSIDLTLCDPDIFSDFLWSVDDDQHGSDHFPLFLSSNVPSVSSHPEKWNFKKANWDSFVSDCRLLLNEHSNILSFPAFQEQLLAVSEKHIPRTSPKPRKNKPWFSEECRKAIASKKRAYRKFITSRDEGDLVAFKIARAKARRTIRESKRSSFRNYVSKINNRTPMSKIWKMVNKLKGTDKSSIKHVKCPDGSTAETEKGIAEAIAQTLAKNSSSEHYTSKFQKHKAQAERKKVDFSSSEEESYNLPFSLSELKTCISDLSCTAPGPDKIHNEILKRLPDETLALLLTFFNHFWTTHTFPDSWRDATVIPIPKPGKDHSNPSNYRPIALTSCLCKLMEKLVNGRLMFHLENSKLLTNLQSGFRKNRSTMDHLVRLERFIREAFAKQEHLVAVFFDLEKAFDTTWKHGILKDLHSMGFRGHLPEFVRNFLSHRQFSTRVGSSFSEPHEQEEGVPQGSILSPILFEIKINSITNTLLASSDCSLYVDDFVVCYKSKAKMETVERQLQIQLKRLEEWADLNGFKFSPGKTVAVHFCLGRKCVREPDLYLYKKRIPVEEKVRFLGLIFDRKLSFLPHIRDLRLRCQKALNALKALSSPEWGGGSDILLNLYRSLVRSKLDYGCFIYGAARPSYIKQLDPIHHQGLRCALGAFRTSPVDSLLAEAGELPLHLRRRKLGLQYALKIMSTPDNPAFESLFQFSENTITNFAAHPNKIAPFGLRVKEHWDQFEMEGETISPFRLPSVPPWELGRPEVDLSLTKFSKSATSRKTFQKSFQELIQKYPNHVHLYTDGSKDPDTGVGAAVYSDEAASNRRLNFFSSVFSAEAAAIELALDEIEKSDQKSFVILSDSLSCLSAMKSFKLSDTRILSILERVHALSGQKKVIFAWIPGHMDIPGNDCADSLAKEAASLSGQVAEPLHHADVKPMFQRSVQLLFKNYWFGQTNNKLNKIMPDLKPVILPSLGRKHETVLHRLRIGHTSLTHSYLLRGEPPPLCEHCDQPLTVKHFLLDCHSLSHIRNDSFRVTKIEDLFNPNIVESKSLVSYVRKIGLLDKV